MFTIKNVNRGQSEDSVRLYEGRNVMFEISPRQDSDTKGVRMQVAFTMDDGTYCTIDSGVVFVMNSSGKTVDTYRLENSDWY